MSGDAHDVATAASEVAAHAGVNLVPVVALLAAGVVAVPLFKKLGLGSVLGYLAAGVLVGPFGLAVVKDAQDTLHVAELGVVMFLFVIGLEMEPSKLWSLRRQIFGLGVLQVVVASALLTGVGVLLGFTMLQAFVAGTGFVLTSTAIVMQVLAERGESGSPGGQKIISILLLEDLAIVPLLAALALLAPAAPHEAGNASRFVGIGLALAAVVALVAAGRYLLNPLFRVLANAKAREVMTAAALLVVLGAALLMQVGGLSMAMGAFLAGVLLSTSSFRHQLEADVEPFRGILLGLFFLAVGMSLDLRVIVDNASTVALSVVGYMVVKSLAIYLVARALKSPHREALDRAVLMSQGGEFAFVLYTTAVSEGIFTVEQNALFTATVIVSMVLTPLLLIAFRRLSPAPAPSLEGLEAPNELTGNVLIIGFGRFGQIASQSLLAMRHKVSIIDNDPEMITAAAQFGFKVYYGDGTRLDILHAAGAHHANAVLVCVDNNDATTKIAGLLKHEFPLTQVFARAFDRGHAIELVQLGVAYQLRELFESALLFGGAAIAALGASDEEVAEVLQGIRDRDRQRFELQTLGGMNAGRDLLLKNATDTASEQGVQAPAPLPAAVVADDQADEATS
jgi:glutathione-regulated potassium-efflux system protein KefB